MLSSVTVFHYTDLPAGKYHIYVFISKLFSGLKFRAKCEDFLQKKFSVSRDFIYFIVPSALLPAVPGLALLYHIQKCQKSNKVVLSCLVLSCPCLVLSCLVLSCLVLSCLVLSCLVLSCLALPCLALPCLALPCLALPCLAFEVVLRIIL